VLGALGELNASGFGFWLKEGEGFFNAGGVKDDEELVFGESIEEEVVDDAAVFI